MWTGIATLTYGIAAVAFLLLAIVLLTYWRKRAQSAALAAVCLLTAAWAAVTGLQAMLGHPGAGLTQLLEVDRSLCWLLFLAHLLKSSDKDGEGVRPERRYILRLGAVIALTLLLVLAAGYTHLVVLALAVRLLTHPITHLSLAMLSILFIEQLFRHTPSERHWGIKFACFGIGGMFAYDFYLYSDTILFNVVNAEIWTARGIVDALAVPLLAISTARNPKWNLGISVSRRALFHSATLLGSAVYLLAMAAAGYYLRFFGGNWGSIMQVAFLFGAIILLAAVLFSGTFRAWLKVFISKHFYSYNYDYREEWISFTRTLSETGPGLGERAIQAVAKLVESPSGLLLLARESGLCERAAQWNMKASIAGEPIDGQFCKYLLQKQWVIDLQDHETNPAKYDGVDVPAWLKAVPKAWLVIPLIVQGKLLGMMILAQPRSKITINWEVIDLLKIAGSQAASHLAQQESDNALMISRQFESFSRMSTFMVHDLKNLISQLSLLLANAEKHQGNPEFQKDMLETVHYSVQKMKLLLQKLGRERAAEHPAPVCLDELLQQLVASKASFEPSPQLEAADTGIMVHANRARLERVIGHLVQNAIEASNRNGRVTVRLMKQDDSAVVEVEDNGEGMSEEFIRERLFKPFESTKSAGMGIGVFETREYVRELGGSLSVTSEPGVGTTFRIILPLLGKHATVLQAA
jgi:putative PEP-CTERM system histidine kinase